MVLKKLWRLVRRKKKRSTASGHFTLTKVYTPVTQLTIGMYIVELDRPWLETNFAFQGFELRTKAEIQAVKEVCQYVYIDLTKRSMPSSAVRKSSEADIQGYLAYGPPPQKLSKFEHEIGRSVAVYESSEIVIQDFMEKIASGGGIDSVIAREAVAACVNSVLHSPDAMLWITQLRNKDRYTAQHSLNICVLSVVLGRYLNLPEAALNNLGLCGMMHDMGKMLIPIEILNKPGALEPDEMDIIRTHTTLGYNLLKSTYNMYPGASDVAHTHHERMDGKGYPRRIQHGAISFYTKIVTIADVYDAIISDRVYQKGRTHLDAINTLSNHSGTHLDAQLVVKFIESLGVYPPGCIVEMTNGCIAVVVEVNDKVRLRPKIIILLDEDKNPVKEEKVMDLSEMVTDRSGGFYTIKQIVKAEDWKIDTMKYYQDGVLQKGFSRSEV